MNVHGDLLEMDRLEPNGTSELIACKTFDYWNAKNNDKMPTNCYGHVNAARSTQVEIEKGWLCLFTSSI
jgi:hypothetical protein